MPNFPFMQTKAKLFLPRRVWVITSRWSQPGGVHDYQISLTGVLIQLPCPSHLFKLPPRTDYHTLRQQGGHAPLVETKGHLEMGIISVSVRTACVFAWLSLLRDVCTAVYACKLPSYPSCLSTVLKLYIHYPQCNYHDDSRLGMAGKEEKERERMKMRGWWGKCGIVLMRVWHLKA